MRQSPKLCTVCRRETTVQWVQMIYERFGVQSVQLLDLLQVLLRRRLACTAARRWIASFVSAA